MLLQFKISNFMSIRDEIVVNLTANSASEHEENNIVFGRDRILPVVAFYGYNAVGKSNIFKALSTAILFVRNSSFMPINALINTQPFLLDDTSRNESTKMDFIYIHNGKKYNYGFEITQKEVIQEYLYEYVSARPSLIFDREKENYTFTTKNNKELDIYKDRNTPNKLFLATATNWNCQLTKDAFLWFAEGIDTYDSHFFDDNQYLMHLDANKDDHKTKEFLLNVLKNTDINISDYNFESNDIKDISKILPPGINFDKAILDQIQLNSKEFKLDAMHDVKDENGNSKSFPIAFMFESNGTKLMFAYAPIVQQALEKGRTIIVDELDNGLNPILTKYLVKLFTDKKSNKNGAQLLFNSHESNLLDNKILRRDQIYLVNKDDYGQTKIKNLYDYKARRTDNFRKNYFDERYSDLPHIIEGIDWNRIQ